MLLPIDGFLFENFQVFVEGIQFSGHEAVISVEQLLQGEAATGVSLLCASAVGAVANSRLAAAAAMVTNVPPRAPWRNRRREESF